MGRGNGASDPSAQLLDIERVAVDGLTDLNSSPLLDHLSTQAAALEEKHLDGEGEVSLSEWEQLFPEESWRYLKAPASGYLKTATRIRLREQLGEPGEAVRRYLRLACVNPSSLSEDEQQRDFVRKVADAVADKLSREDLSELVPGQVANRFTHRVDDWFYQVALDEAMAAYRTTGQNAFITRVYEKHPLGALISSSTFFARPEDEQVEQAFDNAFAFCFEQPEERLQTALLAHLTARCWPKAARSYWIDVASGAWAVDQRYQEELKQLIKVWGTYGDVFDGVDKALKADRTP